MYIQIALFGIILIILLKIKKRDENLPPGEWGLPIVGTLPFIGGDFKSYVDRVKHKYGKIFCVQVGTQTTVILRDFKLIKEHFSKRELTYRPYDYSQSLINLFKKYGIVLSHGPVWDVNRRFAQRHLKNFGLGRAKPMQEIIYREAKELVQELETKVDTPIDIGKIFSVRPLNVMWNLVANQKFDPNNEKIRQNIHYIEQTREAIGGPIVLFNYLPFLRRITPTFVKNRLMKIDQIIQWRENSHAIMKEFIEEHKKTLDKSAPRDYIDAYLIDMEDNQETNNVIEDPVSNLIINIDDLFVAGSDTTVNSIGWFLLYMGYHPEIQKKIQQELDSVLPRTEMPLVEDIDRLPYLKATIHEVLRVETLAPLSVGHAVKEDYYIGGFKIPKDAWVFASAKDCHNDPTYWDKPQEFDPTRFLDPDGNFKMQTEAFLPFGYGKRQCLGESLAKMEMYMFLGAILQNFKISLPQELNLVPKKLPLFNFAPSFNSILTKRA